MVNLEQSFAFKINPIAPYDFGLTIRKPMGWSLFSPLEIYQKTTVWTALRLETNLVGLKLSSRGTVNEPCIAAKMYLKEKPPRENLDSIKSSLIHCIGADDDLHEFYAMAKEDSILKHAVEDLYGMHSTSMGDTVFPSAVLAILLQMAPLKRSNDMMDCVIRKYGDVAEFDGKMIHAWPSPGQVANLNPSEFAKTCKIGYRAGRILNLAEKLVKESFPTLRGLEMLSSEDAKKKLLELPGIGDYSADIINPHGGFPIDVWSAEVFSKLFFGKEPENNREAVEDVKNEGVCRWGKWSWMAFFYIVQDLENLSKKLNLKLRLA